MFPRGCKSSPMDPKPGGQLAAYLGQFATVLLTVKLCCVLCMFEGWWQGVIIYVENMDFCYFLCFESFEYSDMW